MVMINDGYDMELQQLRLFLAAAESESFTRGAERAFVSQPALSASISKLETEMDTKLFTRNKRNVVLTPAGRKLLKRAKRIIEECSKAKEELKRHNVQSMLRLGVVNTLPITLVASLIEQYRRENPGLMLHVIDASGAEIEKLERDDRIDLSLTLLTSKPSVNRRFTYTKELFGEGYVLAMTPNHHLSQSTSISFHDLIIEPFITRSHCEHRRLVTNILKTQGIRLNNAYVTNQDDRALALVKAGIGVAIIPECYDSSDIITRPLQEMQNRRSIGFEWGEGDNLAEIVKFVEFASTARWS